MRLHFLISLCICSCLIAPPGFAQTPATALRVDDAVAMAVRHNPRLTSVVREINAAKSGVQAARSPANPSLTFTPAITGPGGSDTELLIQQPLEINGARAARTGIANAQLRLKEAGAAVELRNVVYQTRVAYYELVRSREQAAVTRDLLQTTQELDRLTRRQVEIGTRPGIDRTQTGIEVVRAMQQVTLAEGQEAAAQLRLNTLMGQPPDTPVGPLSPLAGSPTIAQTDGAEKQALASRAEIQVAGANREVFLQQARQARAEGMPDLIPQYRADSLTRRGGSSGFGLGISLPLFDLGQRRSQIRQAEQAAQAQEAAIAAEQDQVRQEVALAQARLDAANAIVRSYEQGVLEQARTLRDASRHGFQEGQTSIVALLESQRTYRSVQTEYINAQVEAAIAGAELERATGAVPASLLAQVSP